MAVADPLADRTTHPDELPGPNRAEQAVEIGVFLFLIVPSMVISLFGVKQQESLGFVLVAAAIILRDLALVSLILFFLWRNREPVTRIGWTFTRCWRDLGLGIVLFVPFVFGAGFLEKALQAAGLSAPTTPRPAFLTARGPNELILASALVVVVAVAEETIFRGYLLLRLKTVTRSSVAAVILSSAIFSVGHGYEGSVGVATVGVMGLVLALVCLWRKSLVAPVVIHFLQDFAGIVLLPLLTGSETS